MPGEMIFPPLQELELDLRMLPRFEAASTGSVKSTAGGSISTERSTFSTTSYESSGPSASPAACNPVRVSPEKGK